jgi:hypothetical protein
VDGRVKPDHDVGEGEDRRREKRKMKARRNAEGTKS